MTRHARVQDAAALDGPDSRGADFFAHSTAPPTANLAAGLLTGFAAADGADRLMAAVAPMTVKQFATFMMVAFHERTHTVTSLAEGLSTTPPVITRTLDRLEGLRLVSRQRSDVDRRVVNLALTRKGEELARLINRVLKSALAEIAAGARVG
jgi:DNA-binding MarR family transcriptional regulator